MTDSQSTPPNAADSAAQTAVGALLRQSREGAGLKIADAARALRISQKYLEALEDGRHADLPGAAYAIGFVRSYAEHLHLDSDEIVRRYKDEAAGVGNRNDLVFPKPIVDGGVPGGAVLGLGVMVAAVAYGVWYWNSTNTEVEIARVEVVPEHMAVQKQTTARAQETAPAGEKPVELAEPNVAPDNDAPIEAAPSITEPVVEAPVVETPVEEDVVSAVSPVEPSEATVPVQTVEPVETVSEAVAPTVEPATAPVEPAVGPIVEPVVEDEAEPVVAPEAAPIVEPVKEPVEEAAAPQAEDAPQVTDTPVEQAVETASAEADAAPDAAPDTVVTSVTPAPRLNDGPSRITVRAKSNSWIQVRDEIADRLLFTRLLREGQEYQVPNRDGLRLMTGNAGALELLVDGKAVPAIGDVGEVRRNVELDVVKLQNGSAVSE
mgnify:FL=1